MRANETPLALFGEPGQQKPSHREAGQDWTYIRPKPNTTPKPSFLRGEICNVAIVTPGSNKRAISDTRLSDSVAVMAFLVTGEQKACGLCGVFGSTRSSKRSQYQFTGCGQALVPVAGTTAVDFTYRTLENVEKDRGEEPDHNVSEIAPPGDLQPALVHQENAAVEIKQGDLDRGQATCLQASGDIDILQIAIESADDGWLLRTDRRNTPCILQSDYVQDEGLQR